MTREDLWSEEDLALLVRFYTERIFVPKDKFGLQDLADLLKRQKSNVSRKARSLGLTSMKRRMSVEFNQKNSERMKERIKKEGHPRGMLGKTHSEEMKAEMSERVKRMWNGECEALSNGTATFKSLQTRFKNGTLFRHRSGVTWKGGERNIQGKAMYFRSSWEANFARYLCLLKESGSILSWEYEPDTFWFDGITRGTRSYTPDFKVFLADGTYCYVEIKGWMDQKSKTKLERMSRYYPNETIVLIQKKEMASIKKTCKSIIGKWEESKDGVVLEFDNTVNPCDFL